MGLNLKAHLLGFLARLFPLLCMILRPTALGCLILKFLTQVLKSLCGYMGIYIHTHTKTCVNRLYIYYINTYTHKNIHIYRHYMCLMHRYTHMCNFYSIIFLSIYSVFKKIQKNIKKKPSSTFVTWRRVVSLLWRVSFCLFSPSLHTDAHSTQLLHSLLG